MLKVASVLIDGGAVSFIRRIAAVVGEIAHQILFHAEPAVTGERLLRAWLVYKCGKGYYGYSSCGELCGFRVFM